MKQVEFSPLDKILMEKAGETGQGQGRTLVQFLVGAILCSLLVFALLQEVSPGLVFWASLVYVFSARLTGLLPAGRWQPIKT